MYGYAAIGVVILAIIGGIWYKYNDLNNQIEYLQTQLDRNISKNNEYRLEMAISKGNVDKLKEALNTTNDQLKKLTVDKNKISKAFEDYKNLPLENKIKASDFKELLQKDAKFKETCEYGLELNKKISGLKYEDF